MSENKSQQKSKLILIAGILAMGLLAATLAGGQVLSATAQTSSTDGEDNDDDKNDKSTVSTSGTATTKVTPDKVTVTVGVETDGKTAEEAASKNADLVEKVIATLKDFGIKDDEMSTSYYNVYPVYENKSMPCIDIYPQPPECQPDGKITGYKASNSISITIDADKDAGKVIDTAIGAGANNVNGVYFFVSTERQQEIRDSLIKEAIANARHRADTAAEAVGMEVAGVQSLNLNDVYFPVFYDKASFAEGASSGASTQVLPGQQEISSNVSVTFFMN